MGYLGLTPTTAQQNYLNIDDISGSFNGTTTSFALQVGGVAPTPFPVTNSCLISVGGVIQQPDDTGTDGFRISGSNIVFSSAPGTGEDFFGLVLAGADYLNVGANFPDGTVGTPSITFESDLNTGIYHPSADSIAITSGGTAALTIDSNRRVGIGTTNPQRELHVQGATNGTIRIQAANSATSQLLFSDSDAEIRGRVGYYHPDDALDFYSAGQERFRIDSSGRLLVGTFSSNSVASKNSAIQISRSHSSTLNASILIREVENNTAWPALFINKNKDGNAMQTDNRLGAIEFAGDTGSGDTVTARINADADAGWGASSHPTRLVFATTASGETSPTERLRIHSNGNILLTSASTTADQSIQFGDSGAPDRGFFNYRHSVDQMQIGTAGSTRVAINSDGGFAFNSGYGSVGIAYGVRAWVNFNGSGTVAIRESGNVGSITDEGTGDYRINFTNAMPDNEYAVAPCAYAQTGASMVIVLRAASPSGHPMTTGWVAVVSENTSGRFDSDFVTVSVIR